VARYDVFIKPSALKELEAVGSKKERQRIVRAIRSLAKEPRPSGCRKLSGKDKYRIRSGQYRIVYAIEDAVFVVTIVKVAHRREAYR
jgi:mRNA interferase RelE/StbE